MMVMAGETKAPQNESTRGGLLCYSGFDMARQQGDGPAQRQPGSATDPGSSGGLGGRVAGGDRHVGSILRQDFNNNGSSSSSSNQRQDVPGSSDESRRQGKAEINNSNNEAQAPAQAPAACETATLQGASAACYPPAASLQPPPLKKPILMPPQQPILLLMPPPLLLMLAPPPAPAAVEAAAAAAPPPPLATAEAQTQTGRTHQHPLGCMFFPELDKAGVLEVVSEVLCKPGYTSGPSEEKRLLRSVGSGRVDIRTMARLLRWLRGERAARELRDRGLKFVGPSTEAVLRPITTGLGMTHLTKEVRKKCICVLDYFKLFHTRYLVQDVQVKATSLLPAHPNRYYFHRHVRQLTTNNK